MSVCIQCKADTGMAKNLGERFDIHSLLNRPRGEGVTKRVKCEVRKPGRFQNPDVVITECARLDRLAEFVRHYISRVFIGALCQLCIGFLRLAPVLQIRYNGIKKRDRTSAVLCLGRTNEQLCFAFSCLLYTSAVSRL